MYVFVLYIWFKISKLIQIHFISAPLKHIINTVKQKQFSLFFHFLLFKEGSSKVVGTIREFLLAALNGHSHAFIKFYGELVLLFSCGFLSLSLTFLPFNL